jgi:hypothetical protein
MKTSLKYLLIGTVFFALTFTIKDLSSNAPVSTETPLKSPLDATMVEISRLPDGSLKSNLSAVLGAEFANSSDELNEILQAYAVMKLEELKKENPQKQIYGNKPNEL